MLKKIKSFAISIDGRLNSMYTKHFTEKNGLLVFLFHGLFENEFERQKNHMDGSLGVTIEQFESFAQYLAEHISEVSSFPSIAS